MSGRRRPLIVLVAWFALLAGAASCGAEGGKVVGRVAYFTGDPAGGVVVTATTKTDLKEQATRATLRATTSAQGAFEIQGLLPGMRYRVEIADLHHDESYFEAPEDGLTRSLDEIRVYPVSSSPGAAYWRAGDGFRACEIDTVEVRTHKNFSKFPMASPPAFSVANEDIDRAPVLDRKAGALVVSRMGVTVAGRLYHIESSTRLVGARDRMIVEDAWYYMITGFEAGDWMGVECIRAQYGPPSAAFRGGSGHAFALTLDDIEAGAYLLVPERFAGGVLPSNMDVLTYGYVFRVE